MFPDEDRVEGLIWKRPFQKNYHLGLFSGTNKKFVGPLLVVASAFSGPNDLKHEIAIKLLQHRYLDFQNLNHLQ